jgi:hypothetical protein
LLLLGCLVLSPFASREREPGLVVAALLPTGMDPSIHSDVFARYERRVLEIKHRLDDIRNFTNPTQG